MTASGTHAAAGYDCILWAGQGGHMAGHSKLDVYQTEKTPVALMQHRFRGVQPVKFEHKKAGCDEPAFARNTISSTSPSLPRPP